MFYARVDGVIEERTRAGALPKHAAMLAALHRAHERELREAVRDAGIRKGDRVLDLACGDGAYTVWLAKHVGDSGRVVGLDTSQALLGVAKARVHAGGRSARVELRVSATRQLPFRDESFDVVWCARSFADSPDLCASFREMVRVVRRGGRVVVLATDALHHVLLPWSNEVELILQQAQRQALRDSGIDAAVHTVERRLAQGFACSGLSEIHVDLRTVTRADPLGEDDRAYLAMYLRGLRKRIQGHVPHEHRRAIERWLDPRSRAYILNAPDFRVTYLYVLAEARRV